MNTIATEILETFSLPVEAELPFREADICYRAGAYRAALLFSYLGWGLTLRARLMLATIPAGLQAQQWQSYLSDLRREDRWDAQVFDLTQMRNPAPVFLVPEDLRHQVRYWKDRRNDCAHLKANEINHAHVESFWQFIYSNMGKFVPNGSAASLQNELRNHFDPNITPPNTPVDDIVARIPHCIENAGLSDFFRSVTTELTVTVGTTMYRRSGEIGRIFDSVLRLNDLQATAGLTNYLLSDLSVLLEFIRQYPQHVALLRGNAVVIRQIWHQHLFSSHKQDIHVFAAIIRNGLIPPEEIEEANEHIVAHLHGDIPGTSDAATLQTYRFFEAFERKAFTNRAIDDFEWGNGNCQVIPWYLSNYPISNEAVRAICGVFRGTPYPYAACNSLKEFFQANQTKRHEFENLAQLLNEVLPTNIFSP